MMGLAAGIDLRLTEKYLLRQPEVVDAKVIAQNGHLEAEVIVPQCACVSPRELQKRCLENLGIHQTPQSIVLVLQKGIAA